jgi:hypothetical protein
MTDEKGFTMKETGVVEEKESHGSTGKKQPVGDEASKIPLPEINFSTFIMSLNASALVNLGMMDDPITGQKSKNLTLAKQTIDLISMLQDKTMGNLTSDEEKMVKTFLYDLRIIYVREKE